MRRRFNTAPDAGKSTAPPKYEACERENTQFTGETENSPQVRWTSSALNVQNVTDRVIYDTDGVSVLRPQPPLTVLRSKTINFKGTGPMSDHLNETAKLSAQGQPFDRRSVGAAALGLAMAAAGAAQAQNLTAVTEPTRPRRANAGPPVRVAMLLYPHMILLDMVGPQTILHVLGAEIHLVGETMAPVLTDVGISLAPTITFADCPSELDVLFVPGGLIGSIDCMRNQVVLDFLAEQAKTAKYVTSVCTGGLVLGAAGLLRGYQATAHWGVADLLPIMGAIRIHERVVQDRNRLTGAGATAGLDFGLTLAAVLRGQAEAERVQLVLEYAPQPPFHAGNADELSPERLAEARAERVWMDRQAREAALAAAKRLGI